MCFWFAWQTAAMYVADTALCPEEIRGVWNVGTPRGWAPSPDLRIRVGPADARRLAQQQRPLYLWSLWRLWRRRSPVLAAVGVGVLTAACWHELGGEPPFLLLW